VAFINRWKMDEKIVISASRTKDLVRVSPGRLAEILRGQAPVRFGLGRDLHTLSLKTIGALAIWTKDPTNMLIHPLLRETLERYCRINDGVILLNLTVTGLGDSILEPAIPSANQVLAAMEALIDSEIVHPNGIILRYDPLIEVSSSDGTSIGNISMDVFEPILAAGCSNEITRIKTSLVDIKYEHVPRRLENLGIRINLPDEKSIEAFYMAMEHKCRQHGVRLDACCNPQSLAGEGTSGCIDGRLINQMLEDRSCSWRVTNTYHNDIGRQRPLCKCTYSKDIGYSAGLETCFKNHGACLYCYSQKNTKGAAIELAQKLINSNRRDQSESDCGCRCGEKV
jgi:hypothetical protein